MSNTETENRPWADTCCMTINMNTDEREVLCFSACPDIPIGRIMRGTPKCDLPEDKITDGNDESTGIRSIEEAEWLIEALLSWIDSVRSQTELELSPLPAKRFKSEVLSLFTGKSVKQIEAENADNARLKSLCEEAHRELMAVQQDEDSSYEVSQNLLHKLAGMNGGGYMTDGARAIIAQRDHRINILETAIETVLPDIRQRNLEGYLRTMLADTSHIQAGIAALKSKDRDALLEAKNA